MSDALKHALEHAQDTIKHLSSVVRDQAERIAELEAAQQLTDLELAIRILALEEAEPDEDVDGWIEHFNGWFPGAASEQHSGDCTNMCYTCSRCVYEHTMKRVPKYRQVFGCPAPHRQEIEMGDAL